MRHTAVTTDIGEVWFSAGPLGEGPAILLLHGAVRSTDDLAAVAAGLPNVVLGHLPGHGVNDLRGVSVDLWSRAFATAAAAFFADRPWLHAGESLGGLVGLGMARFDVPGLLGVVAVEPPLTYSWPLQASSLPSHLDALLRPSHRRWLAEAQRPVCVVAGDVPLEPPRTLPRTPSLLSAEDRAAASDLVELRGGHELMTEAPADCVKVILERLRRWSC